MVLEVLRPPVFKPVIAPLPLRMPINHEMTSIDLASTTLDKVPTRMTSSFVPYTPVSINNTATLSQTTTTAGTSNGNSFTESELTRKLQATNAVSKMQPPATKIDRKDTRYLLRPIRERCLAADSEDSSSLTSTSLSSSDGDARKHPHPLARDAKDAAKKSPVVTTAVTNVGVREAVVKKKLSESNSFTGTPATNCTGSSPDAAVQSDVSNVSISKYYCSLNIRTYTH